MYKMLFRDTADANYIYYWLASRSVRSLSDESSFSVRYVYGGSIIMNRYLGEGCGDEFKDWYNGCGVRPIVYLKSTVQTSGKDASGAWTIIDK